MEKTIPSDTLAESFINTMPAWINMLLLSSSGPIKTPVGAWTAIQEDPAKRSDYIKVRGHGGFVRATPRLW